MSVNTLTRKIIKIDEEKCDGCGDCVSACHEGAIRIIDGKAKLVSETYCDGLGACIGDCPRDAITIEAREAAPFDEAAVRDHLDRLKHGSARPRTSHADRPTLGGCPGSASRELNTTIADMLSPSQSIPSQLSHWPVQLMLVPPQATWLQGCDLLICADCVPFAMSGFHGEYLIGKKVLVGCPKLDDLQYYYEKMKQIFEIAAPNSITVLKMEVPCCHGIAAAAIKAHDEVVPGIPIVVHTIGIQGDLAGKEQMV